MRYKCVKQHAKCFAYLAAATTFLVACGHYDSGYEDGYDGAEPKRFIIFGRDNYKSGYEQGDFDSYCD